MNKDAHWVHPWREELRRALEKVPVSRKPALRRSPLPDHLFSTDLPACAAPEAVEAFLKSIRDLFWEGLPQAGWIHLRKTASAPEGWFPANPDGEAHCLRELLRRHPGDADSTRELYALMKAREEGSSSFDRACGELHRELARRLRTGEPFPDLKM